MNITMTTYKTPEQKSDEIYKEMKRRKYIPRMLRFIVATKREKAKFLIAQIALIVC